MDTDKAVSMLRLAHIDFQAMRGMLDTEAFDETIFGFHAQQAIVTPADPLDRPAIVAEVGALLEHVTRQVAAQA